MTNKRIRFLAGRIQLAEGATSTVTVTRAGSFTDPRYGRFEITQAMLLSMVENFRKGVYGQDIFIDVAHKPSDGAAGKVVSLSVDGDKLIAQVEWTPFGVEAIKDKGYVYLSAEYSDNWRDNEAGLQHGPVLLGAALTIRPVIKRLDPIRLSEDSDNPTLLHPDLIRNLTEDANAMLKTFLEKLKAALGVHKLAEDVAAQLLLAFESAAKTLGEDEKSLADLLTQFDGMGKRLAEAIGVQSIKLDIALPQPGGKTLSEADVERILADKETKRLAEEKRLAEGRAANVEQFEKLLSEAEGLKALPEETRKSLSEARDLVTADMTADQVKRLAEHQIKLGTQMSVERQLAQRGFQVRGTAHISADDSNAIKSLQESADKRLGLADLSDARRYSNTGGQLQAENKKLADKVLAEYDREHGAQLHREHKMLAGGDGIVSDVAVPAVFERTVIREALYNLVGLQFVDSGMVQFAASINIPYSYRDTTAAGINSTRKYEGQAISRAGVKQTSENAYPVPQKLAFEVSDELRYLTSASGYDWDATAENQRNASRIIGEDIERLIFNEVLAASDEYGSVAVSNEAVATADGTKTIFKLANFPVVRPSKVYDLQGNQVGSTLYAVTVTTNAVARAEYDGTGTQTAGLYYTMDWNLGELRFVSEAGVPTAPTSTHAIVCSYTKTTNAYAFDTDNGSVENDLYWNGFLYRYGLRKSVIEDQRYHTANFGLMSGTARTTIEQARQFAANFTKPGTDLSADGNLGRIKEVPNFKTTAPALNMGDQRIIIGERGQTRFRMMKPWSMGMLTDQRDSNGRFTGKKEAYGDQFIVLHTPTQLKRAYTSIVLYSASARVNR